MQTIAVIFGGRSAEHDISIITALSSVIKPLELTKKYNVEAIYIDKSGSWFWDEKLKDIQLYSSGKIAEFTKNTKPVTLQFDAGLKLIKSSALGKKSIDVDVVFPAMHGTYGEDGSLMGLLEMANVPYVGCSLSASVIAMDKIIAKQIAQASNIPVTRSSHLTRQDFTNDPDRCIVTIENSVTYPLFVKPAHLGSSIGISRAMNREELQNAIEVAIHYDDKILVEEEVQNLIEVTLPIMGNDQLIPGLLERPLTTAEDFFDFDTKYLRGGKKSGAKTTGTKGAQGYSELPAQLPKELYQKTQELALQVYKVVGCSGTARVDMLIDSQTNEVYFNEINPLPGSLYAHNWRASGVSSVELVQKLVDLALERHQSKQQSATSFNTSFLKQF